jgi:hypothetical protein
LKSFQLFLPQLASYQVHDLLAMLEPSADLALAEQRGILTQALQQDWQAYFCGVVNYPYKELPWTQLRLAQFSVASKMKTVVCCDPVMMQLTHRGAYMLGQMPLSLTENEAIRIVAQINERLMNTTDKLYMVDKYSWLFVSEQSLDLISQPVSQLIGKDMFNHSYSGKDKKYWQQLATEIQMLIKQMIDYQGLTMPAAESMMNIHFSGLLHLEQGKVNDQQTIPFIKEPSITLISDNELIKTFSAKTFLSHLPCSQVESVLNQSRGKEQDSTIVAVAFESEKETYLNLLKAWQSFSLKDAKTNSEIICQDSVITVEPKRHWFTQLLSYFKP